MENYEYMFLHKHHPHSWEDKEKEINLLLRCEREDLYIEKASTDGWEIKATSIIKKDNIDLEIFHLQRKNSNSKFNQETFSEEWLEGIKKHLDKRKKMIGDLL